MNPVMLRAALYVRVSTDDQLELSPDAQIRALREYAKKNNILIIEEYIFIEEGKSGKNTNRPKFQQMIKTAKIKPKQFDVILVHKFDRFARNREDSVVFKSLLRKECGIKVISITEQLEDDKFSVILEAMLEAMAEYYSLNLADEVKKGMSEKALKGGFLSRPPYGYRIIEEKKPPVIVPEEAEIIKIIYNKFINEDLSFYGIAQHLNNNLQVTMPSGQKFTSIRIKYILSNHMYCGLLYWNKRDSNNRGQIKDEEEWIITHGQHEAIVTEEIFEKAQIRIRGIKSRNLKNEKPLEITTSLYSSILKCGLCGATLSYNPRKSIKDGIVKSNDFYQCNNYTKGACNTSHSISEKKITKAILSQIKKDSQQTSFINNIEVIKTSTQSTEIEILHRQLANIKNKEARIKEAYAAGVDTLEEYSQNKKRLQSEGVKLLNQIELLKNEDDPAKIQNSFKEKLTNAYDVIVSEDVPIEEKKRLIRSFIKKIVYEKEKKQLRIFYFVNE